jgi:hypothetical protein
MPSRRFRLPPEPCGLAPAPLVVPGRLRGDIILQAPRRGFATDKRRFCIGKKECRDPNAAYMSIGEALTVVLRFGGSG